MMVDDSQPLASETLDLSDSWCAQCAAEEGGQGRGPWATPPGQGGGEQQRGSPSPLPATPPRLACGPRGHRPSTPPRPRGRPPSPRRDRNARGGDTAGPARRASRRPPQPAPAEVATGGQTSTSARERRKNHARGHHAATNRSSMGVAPDLSVANDARIVARPGRAEGRTEAERPPGPPTPRPPLRWGGSRPPPPPLCQAGQPAAGRTRRPGLPDDPDRARTPGGDAPATKGGLGRGPQAAPPRGGRWGGTARPPLPVPPAPQPTRKARGRRPSTPPEAEGMIPPPPGRTVAPWREAGAGPPPRPGRLLSQERRWTSEPAPTHRGATRTAPGDGKRARTGTVRGPRPPWPQLLQGHPLCCLPREGRGTDRGKAAPRPTGPPGCTVGENSAQAVAPPPHPPALERHRRADPPHGEHTAPSQEGGRRNRPPPLPQANQTGHRTGAGHAGGHGPRGTALPAPSTVTARGARARPSRGGGGRGHRGSASAHTHKGHAGKTRKATGPSPRNAQTAWNGVPASEEKGHPDGTARHTQRRKRGAGRGERGRHDTWHRPKPPDPAASVAHTQPGRCTRQGSSGAPSHAPAPRLGSLGASSTGPAAPAPRTTTHQGGDAVGNACSYGC